MLQDNDGAGFGLYIHWPFCRSKCPYCDFNSHVEGKVDHRRWQRALLRELDHVAEGIGRRPLTSIFFGGGTPSLMDPATVEALITRASEQFGLDENVEITLEVNPTSAERDRLADFRTAGVNRVSIGVQALDDQALRFLGREHSAADALTTVDQAAHLFPRFSFDLIYARPDQSTNGWRAELERALGHAGGHLSVYQLTIEPGTRFFNLHRQGKLDLPDDDLQADLFELTREKLTDAGLPPYEVSNHAAPGEASRHNLVYWRAGDYAGIGPGAHGRLSISEQRFATSTERMPRAWIERVETVGHGEHPRDRIAVREQVVEMLLMGLRLESGIEVSSLERLSGIPLRQTLNAVALDDFENEGWIDTGDGRLRVTAAGTPRQNAITAAILDPPPAVTTTGALGSIDGRLTAN
ncbi:MAG: radical SAM family heme chaperone HemW [Pseudomonadota bacterium]